MSIITSSGRPIRTPLKWWEWPFDFVPVAYYYQDRRSNVKNNKGCCIYEITSMPNPIVLWFGLFCVPCVAVLAWRERNKAYALLVMTYLDAVAALDAFAPSERSPTIFTSTSR